MTHADDAPYLDYRVRWRVGASRPGRHAASQVGNGGEFKQYKPFWQLPDARQIDVKRSALDPFGAVIVRQTGQRSSIDVVLAIDLSRSMQPMPERSGLRSVARLAEAAARAALRAGDGFGIVGFDRGLRDDVWLPPTRSRAAARLMVAHLASLQRCGVGFEGIEQLTERLPARRCLVLLISDFRMPIALIERALAALARHDVAPVVLETDGVGALPSAGLLRLADAETGQTRLVLMRPSVQRRWRAAAAARRQQLDMLFLRYGRPAFHAAGALNVRALSDHLAAA